MENPYETGVNVFNSRISGNPYTLVNGLNNEELARVQKQLLYWKFYKGNHWDTKRPPGEPQNTMNYSARFVDKGVSFLMGKGFTVNFSTEAEDILQPFVSEVLDDNNRLGLGLEMAQSGGVSGEAWVRVSLQKYDEETEPMYAELYPEGRVRITTLPSYSCFPRWNNHDKDKLDSLKIIYPIQIPDKDGNLQSHWYREEITPTWVKEYIDDELIKSRANDLGTIYVVRVKNLTVANESFGKSDLQDIVPLNKEFNEKTTDVSDIINYHASPVTLVFGAKTNNLEKGARKIWGGLPKDSKVENLELKTDLSASMNYIKIVKDAMFEVASMPSDALGAETNVSNTSGIALHIKNQPLIDTNNSKKVTYGQGIEEICRLIVRIADVYELEGFEYEAFRNLKPKDKWNYKVDFPNPLPKDEQLQVQLLATKISNQLITRIDALKELGENDAVGKLEEIKEEFVEWQDLMFENMPEYRDVENNEDINIGGVNRDEADLNGHTGRNHSKSDDSE